MITIPTYLTIPRKKGKDKRVPLNLNWYRNAHYRLLNEAKKTFHKTVKGDIKALPQYERVSILFTFYLARNVGDIDNLGSVVCKFFLDSLVKSGKLVDDNFKIVHKITFEFGGVDRDNPRCEVTIRED